jgi:hypothetical protein
MAKGNTEIFFTENHILHMMFRAVWQSTVELKGDNMKAYQNRVVREKRELDGKLERLYVFIGSGKFRMLSKKEQKLLVRQGIAMEKYSVILAERIAAFEKP